MDQDHRQGGDRTQSEDVQTEVEIFDVQAQSMGAMGQELTASADDLMVRNGQTIKLVLVPDKPAKDSAKKKKKPHPQQKMSKFWANFDPEHVGKVTRILPERITDKSILRTKLEGETAHRAVLSYENARDNCIRDVKRIIRECRDSNQKYTDSHWDIERDLKATRDRDCLDGLVVRLDKEYPADAKRVTDVFEAPQFYVGRPSFDDVIQGSIGDCWFVGALSALCCNPKLVERVCVHQDQQVGVYGFVFHRDGEWHQCIIDDKVYLRAPAYDESGDVVLGRYGIDRANQEDQYQELFQRGSQALYFAKCRNQNKTWVSLLEKAYAKAHGDYTSLSGGQPGEAIEDLTGGVTTEIYTTNILDTERFWTHELSRNGKDFIFSCADARWREWRPYHSANESVRQERRSGILSRHTYSILDAYEGYGQRLVKIRNPWGKKEWSGAWSDGSKEWDSEWLTRLTHKFGDDGVFWMTYKDMLSKYKYIDRTRIFGPEWHVAQQWMTVQVPWSIHDYQVNHFSIAVPEDTEAVIVLSQLDNRYFKGLEGRYDFTLQFRVQKDDEDEDEYIARSKVNYELERSVNVELSLQKGTYTVKVKVEATSTSRDDVETVIRNNISRRDKITQIGKLYDLAHQKGQLPGSPPSTSASSSQSSSDSGVSTPSSSASASPTTQATKDENKDEKKEGEEEEEEEEEDPDRDPWNASCVVGLRVYSKQADMGLKVVVPSKPDDNVVAPPTLDRDDVAKSALDEVQAAAEKQDEAEKDTKTDDAAAVDPTNPNEDSDSDSDPKPATEVPDPDQDQPTTEVQTS